MSKKRIRISRTGPEWELIDKRIKELGKKNLNAYLRSEIRKLDKQFMKCPKCITAGDGTKKKQKQQCVEDDVYERLQELSYKMDRPISSIIEDFFIVPLLIPDNL